MPENVLTFSDYSVKMYTLGDYCGTPHLNLLRGKNTMKFKTKVFSLILALTMVLSSLGTIGFAASFSDVDSASSYSSAVSLLTALELLKGYEDGTFRPDGDITRAEFATVVVRTMGQANAAASAAGTTAFEDVAPDNWASGFISVAANLGILSGYGDGNFGPEDNVTYEQAVKMMVCALGYEALAFDKVGGDAATAWPNGYLMAAEQLRILPQVGGTVGVPAKRWQVARLVFNSLEVDLMEKTSFQGEERFQIRNGKTILSEYLVMYKTAGEIIANSTASVSDTSGRLRAGQALITDNVDGIEYVYNEGTQSTAGKIGRVVSYYYRVSNEGDRSLVYLEDKTSEYDVIKIDDPALIVDITGTLNNGVTIEYWETEDARRTSSVKLASSPTIVLNGQNITPTGTSVLWPMTGSLELLDTNSDGSYDRVLITSYETYVVRSVNATDKIITDNYRGTSDKPTLTLNMEDAATTINFTRSDGATAAFSSIAKWGVLSVRESIIGGRPVVDIIISTQNVSGTITGLEDETIYINEKPYKVSKYYREYAESTTPLNMDDTGKFYLDKDGKIAGFDKTDSAGVNYGFIRGVEYRSGNVSFSMVTQTGSREARINGASRVRIDGAAVSADLVASTLRTIMESNSSKINTDIGTGAFALDQVYVSQLVKYTLNNSGEISAIQTIDDTNLNYVAMDYDAGNTMTYRSTDRQFRSTNSSFLISANTQVFIVPTDRSKTSDYARSKGTGYFKDGQKYTIEAYDVTGEGLTRTAAAVVVYETAAMLDIDATSPVAYYLSRTTSSSAPDSDYNTRVTMYLSGYDQTSSSTVERWAKSSAVAGLEVGDAFMFKATAQGYIDSVEMILGVSDTSRIPDYKDTKGSTTLEVVNGLLVTATYASDSERTSIVVAPTDDIDVAKADSANRNRIFTLNKSNTMFGFGLSDTTRPTITVLDPEHALDTLPNAANDKRCRVVVVLVNDVIRSAYFIRMAGE